MCKFIFNPSESESESEGEIDEDAITGWQRALYYTCLFFSVAALIAIGLTGYLGIETMTMALGWAPQITLFGIDMNLIGVLAGIGMTLTFGSIFLPDVKRHILGAHDDSATNAPVLQQSTPWIAYVISPGIAIAFAAFKGYSFAHFLIAIGVTTAATFSTGAIVLTGFVTLSLFVLTASTSSVKMWYKFSEGDDVYDAKFNALPATERYISNFLTYSIACFMAAGVGVSFFPIITYSTTTALLVTPFAAFFAVCRYYDIVTYYKFAIADGLNDFFVAIGLESAPAGQQGTNKAADLTDTPQQASLLEALAENFSDRAFDGFESGSDHLTPPDSPPAMDSLPPVSGFVQAHA